MMILQRGQCHLCGYFYIARPGIWRTTKLGSVTSLQHRKFARQMPGLQRHAEPSTAVERQDAAANGSTIRSQAAREAKDVILRFYDFYNSSNIDGVMTLMAEDCSYHDMIYSDPFEGHAEIRAYCEKVMSIIPSDLNFAVDEISGGDPHRTGVKWHLDISGNVFPFSRGCSFYTVNDEGKIVSARDLVESSIKPGASTLFLLKFITPVIRRLGPNADPANLKKLPIESALLWALYAGYVVYIMLSDVAPGPPAIQVSAQTLKEVLVDSVNFFYVNIFTQWASLPVAIPVGGNHPVDEALFNFINAWSLMFWPLLLADAKRVRVKRKLAWYTGIQFLTNIFFMPYMAIRAKPPSPTAPKETPQPPPSYARIIGSVSAAVGLISLAWVFFGRPEVGGFPERWAFAVEKYSTDRVFFAFVLDAVFYTVWQAVLMRDAGAPARLRYIPFVGQAWWLITSSRSTKEGVENSLLDKAR